MQINDCTKILIEIRFFGGRISYIGTVVFLKKHFTQNFGWCVLYTSAYYTRHFMVHVCLKLNCLTYLGSNKGTFTLILVNVLHYIHKHINKGFILIFTQKNNLEKQQKLQHFIFKLYIYFIRTSNFLRTEPEFNKIARAVLTNHLITVSKDFKNNCQVNHSFMQVLFKPLSSSKRPSISRI